MTEKQGPRVLLVDDEESIQQTLGAVLPVAGYAVYQVREEREAVRRVPLVRPDLVLLDLGLPDIDTILTMIPIQWAWALAGCHQVSSSLLPYNF